MIYGIGTDIAAIDRFRRFLDQDNQALLDRIFTAAELATCRGRKDSASCLAARFAAKEAFLKALGIGLRDGITWHDMEVVNDALGKPELHLSGQAGQQFRNRNLNRTLLSLSHDGGHAVAMVVLEAV